MLNVDDDVTKMIDKKTNPDVRWSQKSKHTKYR